MSIEPSLPELSITSIGKFTVNTDVLAGLVEEAERTTAERMDLLTKCSGLPVVCDLSMFGEAWSPIYKPGIEGVAGWYNKATGESIDGSRHPEDDACSK